MSFAVKECSMKNFLPVLAMIFTALATLVMIVFNLAGAANANAEQIRSQKLWAGGLSLLAIIGIVVGIILMRAGRSGGAAGAAFLPAVIIAIVFMVAIFK